MSERFPNPDLEQEILEKAFMIAVHNGFQQRDEEPDVFMIPEAFIYRHDFAKALWGEERCVSKCHDAGFTQSPLLKGRPLEKPFSQYPTKVQVTMTQQLLCEVCHENKGQVAHLGWKFYLQQMVVADDPIKYLGEHI